MGFSIRPKIDLIWTLFFLAKDPKFIKKLGFPYEIIESRGACRKVSHLADFNLSKANDNLIVFNHGADIALA
jgi:hypothetical protein